MVRLTFLVLALMGAALTLARAHDGSSHGMAENGGGQTTTPIVAAAASEEERARQYFTDLPVITQHGERLRFFTDVLKDRVVLIGLFFRNCKQACPLTTAKLAEVQELLGAEADSRIRLVSVTLDPENDTPEALKEYASKFEAGDDWLFLTGEPANLKQITRRLGHTGEQIEAHGTQYFLGNVGIARWTKLAPNLPAAVIAERVRQMAAHSETR